MVNKASDVYNYDETVILKFNTLEKRPILSNLALSEETKKKYLYVVGIDFGTTYSGVAYSKVGEVDGRNNQPIITEINRWYGTFFPVCKNLY